MGTTQFIHSSSSPPMATQCDVIEQQQQQHRHQQHYQQQQNTSLDNTQQQCQKSCLIRKRFMSHRHLIASISIVFLIFGFMRGTSSNPVFVDNPSLAQFQSGRNIRHLPCIVRKSGKSGVCMFAIDCIKQNGTHLGTCIDRFYFGSCCAIKDDTLYASEISDNSIDQNTISHHFTQEVNTMPTSALFKLTTLPPNREAANTSLLQHDVTQILNSVTHSFATTNKLDLTSPTATTANSKFASTTTTTMTTTTRKPYTPTTHKHSHFVIRTTTKPTFKPFPLLNSTTNRRRVTTSAPLIRATTTTQRPVLTTSAPFNKESEEEIAPGFMTTTPPTKLFTFQIVETTHITPTEANPTGDEFYNTEHIQTQGPLAVPPIKTTSPKPVNITTWKPSSRPKPNTTRKPLLTTTKKPVNTKRPSNKPSRKPLPTTATTIEGRPQSNSTSTHATTAGTRRPTTSEDYVTTDKLVLARNKTTLAPRPKPKPTANIIKVTKPILTSAPATTTAAATTTTSTTTRSTTTTAVPKTTTTTEATTKPSPTTIRTTQTTTTTTATPITTKAAPTTTTRTTATTSTTTTTTATPATHRTPITSLPEITSTTLKTGLVTWTDADHEPATIHNATPLDSEKPSDTERISDSTTSSAIHKTETDLETSSGATTSAPPRTQSTATNTKAPAVLASSSTEQITTTTISNTTRITTEQPATSMVQPLPEVTTTEGIGATDSSNASEETEATLSSSEENTTDDLDLDTQHNSTTSSPVNSLEGVDYRQVCGRRMFPEPRIVGGSNAAFGRWPWQISLRQWRTSTYLHKCGAALLNENWAITAAHCVDNVPPSDLLLRLGEYDLAEEEEPYGYQERRVQIVASHPQFDPRTFEYDLALLRFYEPVVFQPNIIPVCVPENDENFIGQTAFVTGWGRLYEDGPLPSVLQEVAVPVINNTICESMYRAAGYIEHIPHIFICAGWKKGGYDSCEGDSGGPMVLQRESDKRFQLGGVISWGIGCAEANQPGVYTRISEFRDWINQILQF